MKIPLKGIKDETGMMSVEVILSFLVFLVFFGFLVNLINVYSFHNRMQFALEATAHDISSFSYPVYVVTGARAGEQKVNEDGQTHMEANDAAVDQLIDTYQKFGQINMSLSSVQDFASSASDSYKKVSERIENIDSTIAGLIWRAMTNYMNDKKNSAGQEIASLIVPKYLEQSDINFDNAWSSEDILESYHVKNLSFVGTEIFPNGQSYIKLVAQYDIDVSFFNLKISSEKGGFLSHALGGDGNKLHIVQCAVVPGWLDGDQCSIDKYNAGKK